MTLEKQIYMDRITITEYGDLEIREKTCVLEDGQELSFSYFRRVISSGDDVSNENQRIQALYNAAQIGKMERRANN